MTTTTAPVLDGDARRLLDDVLPLGDRDVRYLRKAIRYRLGARGTPPKRFAAAGSLTPARVRDLDRLADWIVQAGA